MFIFENKEPIVALLGEWAGQLTLASIFLRTVLAAVFSALIGCERASKRHAAGLRTFMLVSLATCFSVMIDIYIMETYGAVLPIVTGLGVVGAAIISSNSILYSSKNQIKGLTTSVGLWACAIMGICTGLGMYSLSFIVVVVLICCLSRFPAFERFLKNHSNHFEVHLELENRRALPDFTATIRELGLRIDNIEPNPAYHGSGLSVYTLSLTVVAKELKKYKTHREIVEALGSPEYVIYIEEIN